MPTYEYACEACSHAFEHWQSMTDKKLRTCPRCGKPRLVRLMGTGAGVIFRGSGFYETDYKRSRASGPSKDGAEPAAKDGPAGKKDGPAGKKDGPAGKKESSPAAKGPAAASKQEET